MRAEKSMIRVRPTAGLFPRRSARNRGFSAEARASDLFCSIGRSWPVDRASGVPNGTAPALGSEGGVS